MSEAIQRQETNGPNGETIKVSWFEDKRVRFDFIGFGRLAITKVFPNPGKYPKTNLEVKYDI
jgi:hypothetical protein